MERYARGRATNMAKYRPGIDSPFAWPARGRISQYYGRSHDGLDIAGYKGSPIRAAAFGVVSYIGWNPWDKQGRAFMIVLAHAGGLETLYGHILPRRSVRIGQAVRQGEIIGYMGSTGNSTGPHLHFEVRRGRTTINPLGYL
jgi:murein DD-endopeptidase MepM/ murein hydrolase activator NlpD